MYVIAAFIFLLFFSLLLPLLSTRRRFSPGVTGVSFPGEKQHRAVFPRRRAWIAGTHTHAAENRRQAPLVDSLGLTRLVGHFRTPRRSLQTFLIEGRVGLCTGEVQSTLACGIRRIEPRAQTRDARGRGEELPGLLAYVHLCLLGMRRVRKRARLRSERAPAVGAPFLTEL